jgi:hypothetical protein
MAAAGARDGLACWQSLAGGTAGRALPRRRAPRHRRAGAAPGAARRAWHAMRPTQEPLRRAAAAAGERPSGSASSPKSAPRRLACRQVHAPPNANVICASESGTGPPSSGRLPAGMAGRARRGPAAPSDCAWKCAVGRCAMLPRDRELEPRAGYLASQGNILTSSAAGRSRSKPIARAINPSSKKSPAAAALQVLARAEIILRRCLRQPRVGKGIGRGGCSDMAPPLPLVALALLALVPAPGAGAPPAPPHRPGPCCRNVAASPDAARARRPGPPQAHLHQRLQLRVHPREWVLQCLISRRPCSRLVQHAAGRPTLLLPHVHPAAPTAAPPWSPPSRRWCTATMYEGYGAGGNNITYTTWTASSWTYTVEYGSRSIWNPAEGWGERRALAPVQRWRCCAGPRRLLAGVLPRSTAWLADLALVSAARLSHAAGWGCPSTCCLTTCPQAGAARAPGPP